MYAVIRTGGKQYCVREKDVLEVEKLEGGEGQTVEFTDVLLVSHDDRLKVGTPSVPGARVTATVLATEKGRKVRGYTYKPKKNVQRHYGHRQWHTRVRIEAIQV
ncbi:MAG: 50S ribosomal protein L21 [Chthonomonadales bacterium]